MGFAAVTASKLPCEQHAQQQVSNLDRGEAFAVKIAQTCADYDQGDSEEVARDLYMYRACGMIHDAARGMLDMKALVLHVHIASITASLKTMIDYLMMFSHDVTNNMPMCSL